MAKQHVMSVSICLILLISFSISVQAKKPAALINEVQVIMDINGIATQLRISGENLCQSDSLSLEMPVYSHAFSYVECNVLADRDEILANLNEVLTAGSYLLQLKYGENDKSKESSSVRNRTQFIFTYGTIGEQGPAGLTGPQGNPGQEGTTGPQGPDGAQGLQGLTGSTGDKGIQGSVGPQGAPGFQGLTGSPGPQGVQGLQGPAGPEGPTGQVLDLTEALSTISLLQQRLADLEDSLLKTDWEFTYRGVELTPEEAEKMPPFSEIFAAHPLVNENTSMWVKAAGFGEDVEFCFPNADLIRSQGLSDNVTYGSIYRYGGESDWHYLEHLSMFGAGFVSDIASIRLSVPHPIGPQAWIMIEQEGEIVSGLGTRVSMRLANSVSVACGLSKEEFPPPDIDPIEVIGTGG